MQNVKMIRKKKHCKGDRCCWGCAVQVIQKSNVGKRLQE